MTHKIHREVRSPLLDAVWPAVLLVCPVYLHEVTTSSPVFIGNIDRPTFNSLHVTQSSQSDT